MCTNRSLSIERNFNREHPASYSVQVEHSKSVSKSEHNSTIRSDAFSRSQRPPWAGVVTHPA